jgi:radical SAM superfamily enzyme YgiQ (UPF0313 family)
MPYLSLGMIREYLLSWREGELRHHYEVMPLKLGGPSPQVDSAHKLVKELHELDRPVCLLSSYVWNHTLNRKAAEGLHRMNPGATVIIGGPEVPKYPGETEAFMADNPGIDIAVLGEGEAACAEVLDALAAPEAEITDRLREVTGIVFSRDGQIVRTAERKRIADITQLPSPYLCGTFDPWFEDYPVAILETNRGCPYGCTYCDWGSATLERVTKFTAERVKQEIEYIAERRTDTVFIADANFGMLEQDIEIAQALVDARARTGFPLRLATNFAKNGGRRLMSVIKILHDGGLLPTGIIALQTTDADTLKAIKRDNIKTSSYEKMMAYFNEEAIPMASDIMIGLPGQTVDSLQHDLQFCFDWKVSANGNYTSMMPNAPMAEKAYRLEHQIETDAADMIISTSSFSAADLLYMKGLYLTYQFHVRLGILKYFLYYVQIEHGIAAMDILRRWLDAVIAQDAALPISVRLFNEVFRLDQREGDWAVVNWDTEANFFFARIEDYCEEMFLLTRREFGVQIDDSIRQTLRAAQAAVTPRLDRNYPFEVNLEHDIEGYFEQVKAVASVHELDDAFTSLKAFGPAHLQVKADVERYDSLRFIGTATHADAWELPSALRFY